MVLKLVSFSLPTTLGTRGVLFENIISILHRSIMHLILYVIALTQNYFILYKICRVSELKTQPNSKRKDPKENKSKT